MTSKAEARTYRQRLLELRDRVAQEQVQLMTEARRTMREDADGGEVQAPFLASDLSAGDRDEDITLRLLTNEEQLGAEISAALQRLDLGTFGQCEACHQKIPKGRLGALPYVRHCVQCAEKIQREAQG